MRGWGVQFTAPRRVDVVPVDVAQPQPGQLLVRAAYSGISTGTELLAYRGELDPDLVRDESIGSLGGTFRYPFRYGYSCAGVVERGTATVPAGSLVFAFHAHQDRFIVGEADVVALDPGADPRRATLFPLVETALQLALDAGPVLHEPVVVVGLGTVGLLTALLLRRAGATVVGTEPREWRREVAASVGVDAIAPDEAADRVGQVTGGRGVSLLVELSGAPAALADGLGLLAHEGVALVGSWYGTKPAPLPLGGAFHRRRLTLRSSQVSTIPAALASRWDVPRRRAAARELLADLPLAALPVGEFAFADAPAAYAALDRGERGLLHAALRYE